MNFNIIGAGTWGITFANLLILNGHNFKVLHRNSLKTQSLIENNKHPDIPGSKISKMIKYTDNFIELNSSDITLLAIPSNSISEFVSVNTLLDFKLLLMIIGIISRI